MQFQLPANLREKVAVYDPALKAMINAQQAAQRRTGKKKSSTALGLPDDLFPADVLSKEDQLAIVTRINQQAAGDRHHFRTTDTHCCFIHHTESAWLAFWHRTDVADLTSSDSEYVYGISMAHKEAESVRKKITRLQITNYRAKASMIVNDPEKMEEVKYGRVLFLKRSMLITLDDIQNGVSDNTWIQSLTAYGRNRDKYAAARLFGDSIRNHVPSWADNSGGVFGRIEDKDMSVAKILRLHASGSYGQYVYPAGNLTVESLAASTAVYFGSDISFLSTPFFRRETQKLADATNALYHKKDISSDSVRNPYELWKQQMQLANLLIRVYGSDVPLNHIQKMYQIGTTLTVRNFEEPVIKWMGQNVPITSFIQWFERALKDQQKEWQEWSAERLERYARHSSTGLPSSNFNEFNDTVNMMRNLFERQTDGLPYTEKQATMLDLKAPSRWRLSEFHDHVSAKLWLTSNKNEDMPQDLFPAPIKVEHLGSVWTFFQPRDIHQLGQWGQAVRNCVGNASNYREGVKKKTHFIVLAMIDQKPRFTIQVKVSNGVLDVDQIADVGNRRLDSDERSAYELTFARALIMQNELLTEQAEVEM